MLPCDTGCGESSYEITSVVSRNHSLSAQEAAFYDGRSVSTIFMVYCGVPGAVDLRRAKID